MLSFGSWKIFRLWILYGQLIVKIINKSSNLEDQILLDFIDKRNVTKNTFAFSTLTVFFFFLFPLNFFKVNSFPRIFFHNVNAGYHASKISISAKIVGGIEDAKLILTKGYFTKWLLSAFLSMLFQVLGQSS